MNALNIATSEMMKVMDNGGDIRANPDSMTALQSMMMNRHNREIANALAMTFQITFLVELPVCNLSGWWGDP
jgi:hypothetical protein